MLYDVRHDLAWKLFDDAPDAVSNTIINNCWTAEAVQNYISGKGEDNIILSQTGYRQSGLALRDKKGRLIANGNISVSLNFKDEPHGIAPNPIENTYINHIDTLQASINRHPVNIDVVTSTRQLFLGGANASNTANLWQGRGTSPEMPFASIGAVLSYLRKLDGNGNSAIINVQSDIAFSNTLAIHADNFANVVLKGLNDNKAIKLMNGSANHGFLQLVKGKLELCFLTLKNIGVYASGYPTSEIVLRKNIDFVCDQNIVLINSFGSNSRVRILETAVMDFTGTCAVVVQAQESFVEIASQATLTGSITGKRYVATVGGTICTFGAGANKIPGTTAGTCDANSKYF